MKKILVLVLALAMVLTSFVMPAMAEEDPVVLTIALPAAGTSGDGGTEASRQALLDEMGAEIGAQFEMTMIEGDAGEKLTVMFMSGAYPDILGVPLSNAQLIEYGTEEGLIIPVEEYINADITPNIRSILDEKPAWEKMMTMPDGHIYGIPGADSGGGGHGDVSYKLWMQTEWLDAVGMEMPTTLDEFCDVLRAFKENDPNGNGVADEVGLMGCIGTWSGEVWYNLLNCFGVFQHGTYYYVQDGEVKPCANTDYIREGLSYMNKMYEEGLIDPPSFTQDGNQFMTLGNSDTLISGVVTCGHVRMYAHADRLKGWTAVLPLEGPNGYRGTPYTKQANVSGAKLTITDLCEYPEVAMRFADMVCDEYWTIRHQVGKKGVEWDDADEGATGRAGVATYKYLPKEDWVNGESNGWGTTLRLLEHDWKSKFQVTGDYYDNTNYENFVYMETIKQWDYAADIDSVPPLVYTDQDVATEVAIMQTNYGEYATASIGQFITGVIDIDDDATWEKYCSDLEGFGYSECLSIIQDTINEMGYGK